jgi:hypothetical protein
MNNITVDAHLRQDDYQQIMGCGRAGNNVTHSGTCIAIMIHAFNVIIKKQFFTNLIQCCFLSSLLPIHNHPRQSTSQYSTMATPFEHVDNAVESVADNLMAGVGRAPDE